MITILEAAGGLLRLAPTPTFFSLIALVLVLVFVLALVWMVLRSDASLDLDLRRGRVRIVRRSHDDEGS